MLKLTSIFRGEITALATEQVTLAVVSEALEVWRLRGPLLCRVTLRSSLLGHEAGFQGFRHRVATRLGTGVLDVAVDRGVQLLGNPHGGLLVAERATCRAMALVRRRAR